MDFVNGASCSKIAGQMFIELIEIEGFDMKLSGREKKFLKTIKFEHSVSLEVSQEFRWIMKLKLLLLYLFIASGIAFGQQLKPCKLKISEAPKLRGFSLGTTKTDILKVFPKAEIPAPDKYGVSNFRLHFFPLPDRFVSFGEDEAPNSIDTEKFPAYKGLESIEFEMLDNQAVIITAQYDTSTKWENLQEFVERSSEALKLPKNWDFNLNSQERIPSFLECAGFSIEAELSGRNPILRLVNDAAPEVYKSRKLAEEEKQKKAFKLTKQCR